MKLAGEEGRRSRRRRKLDAKRSQERRKKRMVEFSYSYTFPACCASALGFVGGGGMCYTSDSFWHVHSFELLLFAPKNRARIPFEGKSFDNELFGQR